MKASERQCCSAGPSPAQLRLHNERRTLLGVRAEKRGQQGGSGEESVNVTLGEAAQSKNEATDSLLDSY